VPVFLIFLLFSCSSPDADVRDGDVFDDQIEDTAGGDDDTGDLPIVDADGDGYSVDEDCDDDDAGVHPGATEAWYDGVDQDCDGNDDDADGDGYPLSSECDDTDATINIEGVEVWYDGIDQDCDGNDGDQDGDGYYVAGYVHTVPTEYGTGDCDDTNPELYPGAGCP